MTFKGDQFNHTVLLSEIPRKINSESAAFHVEKRRDSAPYAEEDVVPCKIRRLSGCERDIVIVHTKGYQNPLKV